VEVIRFVPLALVGLACGRPAARAPEPEPAQSYREALVLICEADRHVRPEAGADPLELAQAREDFLRGEIDNPDAIYFRTLLTVKSGPERAAALREEADKVGLTRCELAHTFESGGL
jgi:hypothetical protein